MVVILALLMVAPVIILLSLLALGRGSHPYSTGGTPLPPRRASVSSKRTYDGLGWP